MTHMQTLTAAIRAGHRPTARDTATMLYELQAAFADWDEAESMASNPESWADEIMVAMDRELAVGLFEVAA